jgi:antitoxin component of MazEF toxin-antitoxin module
MQLVEGTPLDLSMSSGALVMRRQGRRSRRSLARIVAQINPVTYQRRRREFAGDAPIGKEIW